MRLKVELGMILRNRSNGSEYSVTYVAPPGRYNSCALLYAIDQSINVYLLGLCADDGLCDFGDYWELVKRRQPDKIIPGIPLDPTLHILMAGHLQDRMRRRGK